MPRYCQQITWDDAPHLTEEQKKEQWDAIPPYQRDARTKGIPILGKGAVYPLAEEVYLCEPFELPSYWPRAYGFDADWNRTAAVWGAWEQESDTVYAYSEYFAGQQPPSVHSAAIKLRGEWMTGAMDPSTHGKISPADGRNLARMYMEDHGLFLVNADNAVEAGIHAVYHRLTVGKLKIFRTLVQLRRQLSIYRRGDNGVIVKEQDDLPDGLRYLIMTGMQHADTEPDDLEDYAHERTAPDRDRSATTGY